MMSQNRQATKDRLQADQDYQVNIKAEFAIQQLHRKVDEMRASLTQHRQAEAEHWRHPGQTLGDEPLGPHGRLHRGARGHALLEREEVRGTPRGRASRSAPSW